MRTIFSGAKALAALAADQTASTEAVAKHPARVGTDQLMQMFQLPSATGAPCVSAWRCARPAAPA
jgi:hypothetical protein